MTTKRYNDQGQVAVLISPRFGAGWYTWHGNEDLLWDAGLVDLVLEGATAERLELYCRAVYGDDDYYGGAEDLVVEWLEPGTEFRIEEYDGAESLVRRQDIAWHTA